MASWSLSFAPASACIPPPARTVVEQQRVDLSEQGDAWTNAQSVFLARIVRLDYASEAADEPQPRLVRSPSYKVELQIEQVLKGTPSESAEFVVLVEPWCVPSDIERGQVDDRFVVYAGPGGPSADSGLISVLRIRDPATLAVIVETTTSTELGDGIVGAATRPPMRSPPLKMIRH